MLSAYHIVCLVGAVATILVASGATAYQHATQETTKRVRVQQISNLLYFCTAIVWPIIFYGICIWMKIDLRSHSYMLLGLAWPLVLIFFRLLSLDHTDAKITDMQDGSNHQETRSTGSLMFSAAFGVGILLGAIKGTQDKDGSRLILLSLMICAAFFIPTHIFQIGSDRSIVAHTVQTCVFHVAIGILLMGIAHSYFQPGRGATPGRLEGGYLFDPKT